LNYYCSISGDSRGDGDVVCTLSLLLLFYVHLYHDDGLVQLKKHLRIIKLRMTVIFFFMMDLFVTETCLYLTIEFFVKDPAYYIGNHYTTL
jgi:hypothetical protein